MNRLKWFFLFVIVLGGSVLFFRNDLLALYSRLAFPLPQIEIYSEKQIADLIKEEEKEVFTPPPLRAKKEAPEAFLTSAGVAEQTNVQREKYGLAPLKENEKLNASAREKLRDMFEKQYFAHISSAGVEVKDLAERVGYEFIVIGENLALGNFQNDQTLVQAWMDSPGHRENILNQKYQEIGVAIGKGEFEGKTTWLAVQHFGLSLYVCPQIDEALKTKIEENQMQLEELTKTLQSLQSEIRTARPRWRQIDEQKIEEYNNLVSQYNVLLEETKILIERYNNQVKLFNACVLQ